MEKVLSYFLKNDSINIIGSNGTNIFIQNNNSYYNLYFQALKSGNKDMSYYLKHKSDLHNSEYHSRIENFLGILKDTPIFEMYKGLIEEFKENIDKNVLVIGDNFKASIPIVDAHGNSVNNDNYSKVNKIYLMYDTSSTMIDNTTFENIFNTPFIKCNKEQIYLIPSMIIKIKEIVNKFYSDFWKCRIENLPNIGVTVKNNISIQNKFVNELNKIINDSTYVKYILRDITNEKLLMSFISMGLISLKGF